MAFAECVVAAFGVPHLPAGEAMLEPGPDGALIVSNLSSSGLDGVIIDHGDGSPGYGIDLDLPAVTPVGHTSPFLRVHAYGSTPVLPTSLLAALTVHEQTNLIDVTIEFPALGPQNCLIEVYAGPELVHQAFHAGPVAGPASIAAVGAELTGFLGTAGIVVEGGVGMKLLWLKPVPIFFADQTQVAGTELRVRPVLGGAASTGFDSYTLEKLTLLAGLIPHLEITDERVLSCNGDVNGDGQVGVDDLLAVILAWSTSDGAADVTDDGIVDADDLVEVILRWGPCV